MQIEKHRAQGIKIPKDEVLRYLGYGKNTADGISGVLIDECIGAVYAALDCRACYAEFDIARAGENLLDLGFAEVKSEALSKNLDGCEKIVLFTATIGMQTDRLIQKYSQVSPSKAVVFQAAGAAAIEEYCDLLNREIAEKYALRGLYPRPRFSPGYGDFPISCQKNIFDVLDCTRKIGVTLTDGMLMMPSKSVSAIIGFSKERTLCAKSGCDGCGKTDCAFRRI